MKNRIHMSFYNERVVRFVEVTAPHEELLHRARTRFRRRHGDEFCAFAEVGCEVK